MIATFVAAADHSSEIALLYNRIWSFPLYDENTTADTRDFRRGQANNNDKKNLLGKRRIQKKRVKIQVIYNLFMYIFLLNAYKSSLGSVYHHRMNKIQTK